MKRNIWKILTLLLALAAVIFCALWQSARRGHGEVALLARAGAGEAYARFTDYQVFGHESDYWGGVAGFCAFQEAYTLLTEGTASADRRLLCSEVYGALLLEPERAKAQLPALTAAMERFAEDPEALDGTEGLEAVRSALRE